MLNDLEPVKIRTRANTSSAKPKPEPAKLLSSDADFDRLLDELSKTSGGTDAMASTAWLDDTVETNTTPVKTRVTNIDSSNAKTENVNGNGIRRVNENSSTGQPDVIIDEWGLSTAKTSGNSSNAITQSGRLDYHQMADLSTVNMNGSSNTGAKSPELASNDSERALDSLTQPPKQIKPYWRDAKVDATASTAWLDEEFADTSSLYTNAATNKQKMRALWCETQWINLSFQATKLGMPKLPYFDPSTMILSKEVNVTMWRQLEKLYKHLGAEQAPYATPIMLEGGEVEWHSFLNDDQGMKGKFTRTPWDNIW